MATLQPRYDSRASFYGKAVTIPNSHENSMELKSYNTIVAKVQYLSNREATATVYGTYSATTLRHIKEFLKQNDFKAENAKQILTDYSR